MNSFQQGIDDDIANVFLNEEEFATTATYTDTAGTTRLVSCIFGSPYMPLEVGDPIQSDTPRAFVHTSDMPEALAGEQFDVDGISHEILETHPCGTGVTVLILSRNPSPKPQP